MIEVAHIVEEFDLDDVGDEARCVHCGCDTSPAPRDRRHAEECPFTTGLWPILFDDRTALYSFTCDGCGEEHTWQFVCARCARPFEDDDVYRLVDVATERLAVAPRRGIGVCVQCAFVYAERTMRLGELAEHQWGT